MPRVTRLFPLPPAAAVAAALALAACQPAAPPQVDPAPPDTCGATPLAGLVGQDAGVLAALPAGTVDRVIRPGMAVTEDYSAGRLNAEIGGDGRILRLYCG